jgi:hypothetical protein
MCWPFTPAETSERAAAEAKRQAVFHEDGIALLIKWRGCVALQLV